MPADLRAEVLKGIDREISLFVGRQWPVPSGLALTALRHLREIVEMHKRYEVGYVLPADATCAECRQHWPCLPLVSLAPDYAPQAFAKMEVDRG